MIAKFLSRYELEEQEQWRDWCNKIPAINFPKEWDVTIIPPFCGAMARFRVFEKGKTQDGVSVYLDLYDRLGFFGAPYWEAYPINDNNERFAMNKTKELIDSIKREFKRRKTTAKKRKKK